MNIKNPIRPFPKEKTIIILSEDNTIFSITVSQLLQKIIMLVIFLILLYGVFINIKLKIKTKTLSMVYKETMQIKNENEELAIEVQKVNNIISTIAQYFAPESSSERNNNRVDKIKSDLVARIHSLENTIKNTGSDKSILIKKELAKIEKIKNMKVSDDDLILLISNQIHQLIILEKVFDSLPIGSPFNGTFRRTSKFGNRTNPFGNTISFHHGIDMASELNAAIYSTGKGFVIFAGKKGSYGNVVEIDHGNNIKTVYAHLSRVFVSKNQQVSKNTKIGIMGSSGRSTSPHLHYEVIIEREKINPEKFLGAIDD